jgi:hypothetical protein
VKDVERLRNACVARGLDRLCTLFPHVRESQWQPRAHGLWRVQHGIDDWTYVRLLPGAQLACVVTGEFLRTFVDDAELEIADTMERTESASRGKSAPKSAPHFSPPSIW